MTQDEMLDALRRVVDALGPYREDAVLVGGFVPLVYRAAHLFPPTKHPALLSGDIDLAVPEQLVARDRMLRSYLDDADYQVVLSRSTEPPTHYFQQAEFGADELAPFYVEFLAPLTGRTTNLDGSSRSPAEVQAGVNAQRLRYLDLLLFEPISVSISGSATFHVPNPASFVVQKLLTAPLRKRPEKRAKDLAYIYDAAVLTRDAWNDVSLSLELLRAEFHPKWFARARAVLDENFSGADSSGPRAVVRQLADADPANAPTEDFVVRLISQFRKAMGL